jgi:periplasmic divalent cation tolerance protein
MTKPYCIILTTASSEAEGNALAEILVTKKLAACVQIMPISSFYTWQGALQKDDEYLLLIKTASELYQQVELIILENHSYEIPEIILLPISEGFPPYFSWIKENTL